MLLQVSDKTENQGIVFFKANCNFVPGMELPESVLSLVSMGKLILGCSMLQTRKIYRTS